MGQRIFFLIFCSTLWLFAPTARLSPAQTRAETANLASDWSDADNPFGPWAVRQGNKPLPPIANWPPAELTYPQQAYAPSASAGNFLPAWFKAAGSGSHWAPEGWKRGDIIVHTTDAGNGSQSGNANVLWTSRFEGTVTVSGGVWNARGLGGRGNTWAILVDGRRVTSATISSNDGHDRDNPESYSEGNGHEAAISRIPVKVGTTISLEIKSTGQYGDFVGVKLTITPVAR